MKCAGKACRWAASRREGKQNFCADAEPTTLAGGIVARDRGDAVEMRARYADDVVVEVPQDLAGSQAAP